MSYVLCSEISKHKREKTIFNPEFHLQFHENLNYCLIVEFPKPDSKNVSIVRWNMSLPLSHCRETRPCFESGHLGVHYTWGRKHRVPLTYLFLREGSFWGACEKLAYLFSRRLGIIIIPRWYGVHGTFLNLLYWNWWSSILETVVSGSL